MVFKILRQAVFFFGVVAANASQDWTSKFEGLQESVRTSPNGVVKEDHAQVLDDLAKCVPSLKERLLVLDLIPVWFKNAKSQFITSKLRSSLRFLVETSASIEEQKKQIEVLGEMASVLRKFPPSPEDGSNLIEVRNMLGTLSGHEKDMDICLLAVDCSMNWHSFHWASPDRKRLIPLLRSFLDGDRAIRDNLGQRAKAALLLSRLAEEGDCDFVVGVLSSLELSSLDLINGVTESYKNLAKVTRTIEQRSLLFSFFETQIDNHDNKVRHCVAEGLQALAEKSEELVERQRLRVALGQLLTDDDVDVVLEVGNGFKHLATKAKEVDERKIIQRFVQDLLQDCEKGGRVHYGAISAYRELVANSESAGERVILRNIAPDFFTYIGKHGYWFASGIFKTFFEKSTEPEERLFFGQILSKFFTKERGGYSDISYDVCSIFVDLADRVVTTQERQMVIDVLTKPYCWPLEKINNAMVAMYETDCKLQVQGFIERTISSLDESSKKGVAVLKLLSETPRSGADLDWIKTTYINILETEGSGIFWYTQEDAIVGCRKLCETIIDAEERGKVKAEFDAVIQKREEKAMAAHAQFTAMYGSFPGDD